MTSRHIKLFEEYVCIAKVAVGPPLSRPIPKLLSNEKALSNKKRVHVTLILLKKELSIITILAKLLNKHQRAL